eukprot:1230146-Rhodomonas_salina.1
MSQQTHAPSGGGNDPAKLDALMAYAEDGVLRSREAQSCSGFPARGVKPNPRETRPGSRNSCRKNIDPPPTWYTSTKCRISLPSESKATSPSAVTEAKWNMATRMSASR